MFVLPVWLSSISIIMLSGVLVVVEVGLGLIVVKETGDGVKLGV